MIIIFAAERQNIILNLIRERGSIKIQELEQELKVSKMTIWRDLKVLDKKGLVKQVHGGAVKKEIALPPEPSFEEKRLMAYEEKDTIARYAAKKLIKDAKIISLGAGSTIFKMMPYLKSKKIKIITNGLQNMVYASQNMDKFDLIGSGGRIRQPALIFVGPIADNFFSQFKADIVFLSGTSLNIEDGIMDPDPLDAEVKQAMCNGAKKKIFLMDSSKINKSSLQTTIKLEDIDLLLLDDKAPKDFVKDLGRKKIRFEIVKS